MDQNDDESEFDDDDRTNDGTLTDDKPQINGSDEETKACNDDKQEIWSSSPSKKNEERFQREKK